MTYKKTLILALLLSSFAAQARGLVFDAVSLSKHKADALWFNSDNAAGLSFHPINDFNSVGFLYGLGKGNFHLMQEGSSYADLGFDTQGAVRAGKFSLWGKFSYNNITEDGAMFNTMLFNPFDERKLYGVADSVSSKWKRQAYLLEFKAGLPLSGKRLYAGLHLRYSNSIAAKQNDPRAESYKYFITLKPSLVYSSPVGAFGLNGYYSNEFERSVPSLSNSSEPQSVYILKGLGNFTKESVGSGGLNTMYYRINTFGASAQYGYEGKGLELLAEAGLLYHFTKTTQSATRPLNMGSVEVLDIKASLQALFGQKKSQKLSLYFLNRVSEGTEHTSIWGKDSGRWEVKSSAIMSVYSTLKAGASYDFFIMEGNFWRWKYHTGLAWKNKKDEYKLPKSVFSYSKAEINVALDRNFLISSSSISAGLGGGYSKSLSGKYSYSGIRSKDAPATLWYPHDLRILTSDYIRAYISAGYSGKIKKDININVSVSLAWLYAGGDLMRLSPSFSLGLLF